MSKTTTTTIDAAALLALYATAAGMVRQALTVLAKAGEQGGVVGDLERVESVLQGKAKAPAPELKVSSPAPVAKPAPVPAPAPAAEQGKPLEAMTPGELRAECVRLGLPDGGVKDYLMARIRKHRQAGAPAPAPVVTTPAPVVESKPAPVAEPLKPFTLSGVGRQTIARMAQTAWTVASVAEFCTAAGMQAPAGMEEFHAAVMTRLAETAPKATAPAPVVKPEPAPLDTLRDLAIYQQASPEHRAMLEHDMADCLAQDLTAKAYFLALTDYATAVEYLRDVVSIPSLANLRDLRAPKAPVAGHPDQYKGANGYRVLQGHVMEAEGLDKRPKGKGPELLARLEKALGRKVTTTAPYLPGTKKKATAAANLAAEKATPAPVAEVKAPTLADATAEQLTAALAGKLGMAVADLESAIALVRGS